MDELELEQRLQRLDELDEKENILEEAKKAKKAKELEELKKLAVEHQVRVSIEESKMLTIQELNAKVYEQELKKDMNKEQDDKEFQERLRATLTKAGYSEENIERPLRKGEDEKRERNADDPARPIYMKIHRKHLEPETLEVYKLPWEWDEVSNLTDRFGIVRY